MSRKKNKYTSIDFITVHLRHIPVQSSFAIVYTILNGLMPAYQTIALANFIDCALSIFNGKQNSSEIVLPIVMIVLYIFFINLMPSIASIISITGKNKMILLMKEIILNKKALLEYRHIESTETQELINRVCSDPAGCFFSGFNNILSALSIIISSVSLLSIIMTSAFFSGLVIVLISIPLFIISMRIGKKNYKMSKEAKKIQRRYNYLSNVLTDREYVNERKLFDYSSSLQNDYNTLYNQSFKIESKIVKKTFVNMKSGSLVTLLVIAIIVSILLSSLNSGNVSVGVFVALVNAVFSLVQIMSWQLSEIMNEYARLQEYLKDFNLFLSLSEKENACATPYYIDDFEFKTLEFRNVSFKYPGTDVYVLKNCSFLLKNGRSYSFVGVNGAGKSTITKLIIGLYTDYEGEILINEKSVHEYNFAEIKAIVSVLFQDFTKYSISLKDNIIMGNNMNFDKDKFETIVSDVGLDHLINSLNAFINTPLGKIKEDGVDISGGEWQRIAIARLLYSNAKINILDEPTASLDPVAESQVYKMFHRINNNRFTIYITHRLGAAKISDEILVVDDGKIVETGSHEQLMLIHNGLYQKMYNSQKSWYE